MADEKVQIKITGKYIDQVNRGLRKTMADLKSVSKFAVGVAAAAAAGVAAATAGLIAIGAKALKIYNDQQTAEMQLAQALKLRGEYTTQNIRALLAEASALQKLTTSGDEANIALMNILLTSRNLSIDMLPRVTKAVLDMAAALKIDARTVALLFQKALDGQTATLSRYGIVVDEVGLKQRGFAAVLDAVEAKFKGQAEVLRNTVGGAWTAAKNLVGDLWEKLGQAISPRLQLYLEEVIKLLEAANERAAALDWSPFINATETAIRALLVGLREMVSLILQARVAFLKFQKERAALDVAKLALPLEREIAKLQAERTEVVGNLRLFQSIKEAGMTTPRMERQAALNEVRIREIDATIAAMRDQVNSATDQLSRYDAEIESARATIRNFEAAANQAATALANIKNTANLQAAFDSIVGDIRGAASAAGMPTAPFAGVPEASERVVDEFEKLGAASLGLGESFQAAANQLVADVRGEVRGIPVGFPTNTTDPFQVQQWNAMLDRLQYTRMIYDPWKLPMPSQGNVVNVTVQPGAFMSPDRAREVGSMIGQELQRQATLSY